MALESLRYIRQRRRARSVTMTLSQFRTSPSLVRAVPFAIFLALTFCQNEFSEADRYWFYAAKMVLGAWLIWLVRPSVAEMRWNFSWEALVVGAGVFVVWVGLDGYYPALDQLNQNYFCPLFRKIGLESWCSESVPLTGWNPHLQFGQDSVLAWTFVVVRIAGSSLVVPPLEEVFFRSFLYRFLVRNDFLNMPLAQFRLKPFLICAVLFGFEHREWLAGILCAFGYHGLVFRKKRLGDAIAAHGLTNLLLGLYVVSRGQWRFW